MADWLAMLPVNATLSVLLVDEALVVVSRQPTGSAVTPRFGIVLAGSDAMLVSSVLP